MRFLLLYKYSLGSVLHLIATAPLGEEQNFSVSGADSSYLVTLGPRGLWSSMRHLDYCGVWSPGEYFRVRTSLFHCREFDILDAHSNIFSSCHLSRFLLSPFDQWTRAVCSTNAEVRLKTETKWYAACGVFVGNTILSVTRQVDGSFPSASTCSETTLSFVAVVIGVLRMIPWGFRLFATWRSDSALSSESSKNARQWHFIRAEGSSNGSWRNRRALQPTCRSRRALEPTCQFCRAGCSESASGIWFVIWIVISSFGIARLHFVVSGIGIVTLV